MKIGWIGVGRMGSGRRRLDAQLLEGFKTWSKIRTT